MLRPATDSDVDTMRAWRNHPANRDVSLTQHVITAAEHGAWWERIATDPSRRVLVFEHAGRPLGVVTYFDIDDRSATWGFYLDHEGTTADGTAFLAWAKIMRDAVTYAFDPPPDGLGVDVLIGEVLAHNESVRAMNRRFGFVEREPMVRTVNGETREVITAELRRTAA